MKYFLFKRTNFSSFRLEKQYFDLIDDTGNCFIIYRAEITFMLMKIHYSEVIYSGHSGSTSHYFSFKRNTKPDFNAEILINLPPLHLSGTWILNERPLPVLTYINSYGKEIRWDCHHPGAKAAVTFRNSGYRGLGYAETLTTTIKPRGLPMNELLWGRFLADGHTIVWICWKGNNPINRLYFNGTEYIDAHFEQDRITFNDCRYSLTFLGPEVIRMGKLSSVLDDKRWIKIFFKKSVMNSVENKFKSVTKLEFDNRIISTGWSLYETVIWKNREK